MNNAVHSTMTNLLAAPGLAALGPESRATAMPEGDVRSAVTLALEAIGCPAMNQKLIVALLLLWHDHLEASHALSQGISSPDGSMLHAMMHRREPDYWNSKYWWRQTGPHPAFEEIGKRAGEWANAAGEAGLAQELIASDTWNPNRFVDACERVAGRSAGDPEVRSLQELQRIEFEVLLERFLRP